VFGQQLLDLLSADPPRVFDRPTWSSEERAAWIAGWERLGWQRLNGNEREDFGRQFGFRPSRQPSEGPCFREPSPSLVWVISAELPAGFALKLLSAFQRITSPGERLLALDATRWFDHYSFDPHRLSRAGRDQWALPAISDESFSIIVAPDFSFGLVGNPNERTLCVFGRPLLDAVLTDPPPGLGPILRCDGQTVSLSRGEP
jgi:hypothetical protein